MVSILPLELLQDQPSDYLFIATQTAVRSAFERQILLAIDLSQEGMRQCLDVQIWMLPCSLSNLENLLHMCYVKQY